METLTNVNGRTQYVISDAYGRCVSSALTGHALSSCDRYGMERVASRFGLRVHPLHAGLDAEWACLSVIEKAMVNGWHLTD
jgi:hypothetical protein